MRKRVATISIVSAIVFVAFGTAAQAPPSSPAPGGPGGFARTVRPTRGPTVVSATKQGGPAYGGDTPLTFDVEIVNDTAVAVDTRLVVTQLIPTRGNTPTEGPTVATVPVRVAANGRATIAYTNPEGLTDGCEASYHRLAIDNGQTTIMRIKPTCSFGAILRNPETGLQPDRIASRHDNRVSYHSASMLIRVPVCGASVAMDATLENQTRASVSGAYLDIIGPNGERVSYSQSKYTLAPGATQRTRVPGPRFAGQPGKWTLKVGADVSADKLNQVNVAADVTRLCAVKTELTNAVTPLPPLPSTRGE